MIRCGYILKSIRWLPSRKLARAPRARPSVVLSDVMSRVLLIGILMALTIAFLVLLLIAIAGLMVVVLWVPVSRRCRLSRCLVSLPRLAYSVRSVISLLLVVVR